MAIKEVQGNRQPANEPGVWQLVDDDGEKQDLIATTYPAADAFARLGYKRVGNVPKKTATKEKSTK